MISIAAQAHEKQLDKGGSPYILHCLAVMHILDTQDEELNCIAVGHDLIEDTSVTESDLVNKGFSERVVSGIVAMTKIPVQPYEEYKAQVMSNSDARKVKAADLTHNSNITRLKGVTQKDFERMKRYHQFYTEIKEYERDQ